MARQSPGSCPGEEWVRWAPGWLREGCLAWLRHQWPRWKASQRRHHAQVRLRELRIFFDWQLARRPLPSLPERSGVKLPDPLPRHLEPGELLALEGWMDRRRQEGSGGESRLEMALYYLLGHAGLRISEALDLQVKDLGLASRRVRVREGKGGRDRVVYLSGKVAELLGEYLETVPHAPGDLVLSWQGRALEASQARRRLHRLGEEVGIRGLSPHRLRHTHATVLLYG